MNQWIVKYYCNEVPNALVIMSEDIKSAIDTFFRVVVYSDKFKITSIELVR